MADLCALTDELIRETLGALDPVRAQFELDREDYVTRVGELQKLYRQHGHAKRLFLAALGRVGVNLRRTCWDWLHLRVLPHEEGEQDRRTGRLCIHRDTWASNIYAQTNWWAPIYRISANRTVAFYPSYWSRPVKNTSGDWTWKGSGPKEGAAPRPPSRPCLWCPSRANLWTQPRSCGSLSSLVISCASRGRTYMPGCRTQRVSLVSASRSERSTRRTRRRGAERPTSTAKARTSPWVGFAAWNAIRRYKRPCGTEVACTIRDDCKWLAQKCEALRRRAK